jgi:gluconate 2-dehydrogenase gamma chain
MGYPRGSVRQLLDTPLVTPATRTVLLARLEGGSIEKRSALDDREHELLAAVCDLLVPRHGEERSIDIAAAIDERLARGLSDGWRYDEMPEDGEAYRSGLRALDALAQSRWGEGFVELTAPQQIGLLGLVQTGEMSDAEWSGPPPRRFFEDLLAECVEVFYSHPLAGESIGYVGMADGRGWHAIGLNEREEWEPPEE